MRKNENKPCDGENTRKLPSASMLAPNVGLIGKNGGRLPREATANVQPRRGAAGTVVCFRTQKCRPEAQSMAWHGKMQQMLEQTGLLELDRTVSVIYFAAGSSSAQFSVLPALQVNIAHCCLMCHISCYSVYLFFQFKETPHSNEKAGVGRGGEGCLARGISFRSV